MGRQAAVRFSWRLPAQAAAEITVIILYIAAAAGVFLFHSSDMIIVFHESVHPVPCIVVSNFSIYFAGLTCLDASLYRVQTTK
ncbi:MAG: hypothetical protein JW904_01510 [Spirochaetales bacterium]|nr:hypothetical protein [Spirochaetales bacterium]